MIDVLLVNPKETGGFFECMPPLGLAYIAANLEKHGHSVKIVDFEVVDKNLETWLGELKPEFVGISGTTHTRFESFDIAKKIKAYNDDIITIYGGVHASFTDIETLENIPEINYVVRGEGEHTLVDLVSALKARQDITHIGGVSFRKGRDITQNKPSLRICDLDTLPFPAYHMLDMDKYKLDMEFIGKKGISIITSRGCKARCSFCSASRMFNYRFTSHSPVRVLDDIENLLTHYGYEGIKFFDSTLTMQRSHVEGVCKEIMRRNLNFPWECEIRVGTVDRATLEKMSEAGCYYVNFGIESASQKVLDDMRKGFTIAQAQALLDMCAQVGMKTKVFFSFGHINETMDDAEQTFAFIDKNTDKITTLASGAGVRVYPGTYLEEYAIEKGFLPEKFRWSLPYDDKRLASILQTRCVPVLLQSQLGFAELEKIALRIYRQRFSGWKGIKRGITKITDKNKLKKLGQLLKVKARHIFKKRRIET